MVGFGTNLRAEPGAAEGPCKHCAVTRGPLGDALSREGRVQLP